MEFFRSIHLLSDKGHLSGDELIDLQKDFAQLIEN